MEFEDSLKDCKKVRNKLSAFIDNELPVNEAFKLRQHLSSCADCKREFETMRDLSKLIGTIKDIEPSPNFWHVLLNRLLSPRRTFFTQTNGVIQSALYKIGYVLGITLKPASIYTFSLDVFNDFPPESFGQLVYLFSPDKVK